MLSFHLPSTVRVFLCTQPTDMRKSFDGLMGLVTSQLQQDPLSGHLFLFLNGRRDRLKILFWDHDGLCIYYKRLEAGTFERLVHQAEADQHLELSATDLALLLQGIDISSARRRKRYRRVG
jgi:transposase